MARKAEGDSDDDQRRHGPHGRLTSQSSALADRQARPADPEAHQRAGRPRRGDRPAQERARRARSSRRPAKRKSSRTSSRPTRRTRGRSTPTTIRAIFREIMSGSRALQKVLKIAYLGPEYSFSHLAAVERFGQSVEFMRGRQHRRRLRGGRPRPRRFRRRAGREFDRRPRRRHARHVHADAAPARSAARSACRSITT